MSSDFVLSHELAQDIRMILDEHDRDGSHLVSILLAVQNIVPMRYIPEEVAYFLAEELGIKVSRVFDCITFYAALHDKPRAKIPIEVCSSIVCHVTGGNELLKNLTLLLGVDVGEATPDGRFIIETVPCFGACDVAPAIRINGKVYGRLITRDDIAGILKEVAKEVS